jgi:hypothetical protein
MSGLSPDDIMAIGELLRLKGDQSTLVEPTTPSVSLVDDYTSSDDEDEHDSMEHEHCRTNHKQSSCLDERCKGVTRCHRECRGCPHIPENKQKKVRLQEAKNDAKDERVRALKAQRIEKYGKMLADATAYKAKWSL